MADETKKFTLYYGGEKSNVPEVADELLNNLGEGFGTLILNLDNGRTLTIVHGPGIPIAVLEEVVPDRKPRSAIFL